MSSGDSFHYDNLGRYIGRSSREGPDNGCAAVLVAFLVIGQLVMQNIVTPIRL
jgi:hypothetical protein